MSEIDFLKKYFNNLKNLLDNEKYFEDLIKVKNILKKTHQEGKNTLILRHEHDGRDLDLEHAEKVVQHVTYLWGAESKLFTNIEGELWEI